MDQEVESGRELVVDNRKLVIAFAILMIFFGAAFVAGFIEGKREGRRAATESAQKAIQADAPMQAAKSAGDAAKTAKGNSDEQQLNWYKNVNRREGEPEVVPQAAADNSTEESADRIQSTAAAQEPAKETAKETTKAPLKKPAADSASKPKPQSSAAHSGPAAYTVQVGAFRVRNEVETKAKALQDLGYDCRIEPPRSSGDFYLLKVGKFSSRADAVAMQLRLKKSGYGSFVKTN